MSQDGDGLDCTNEPSYHYCNNYLNKKPNGIKEEFCIESCNISSGGLKLTISCRKKNSENVQPQSTSMGTDLSKQPQFNIFGDTNNKFPSMEETTSDLVVANDECMLNIQTNPHKESVIYEGPNEAHSDNLLDETSLFLPPVTSPKCLKMTHLKSSLLSDKQDSALYISTQNDMHSVKTGAEVLRINEFFKPHKRFKHEGNVQTSVLHDIHDPLFRLDTLPNVSPDSGIISLDESPFGNESPNSVVNGDFNNELHHSQSTILAQYLNKRAEQQPNSTIMLDETAKDSFEKSDGQKDSFSKKCSQDLSMEPNIFSKKNDDANKLGYENLPALEGVNNNIVSSPHKINLIMGRKKRGRPPKQKKSLLLKHKKSTLYSSLYSTMATNGDNKNLLNAGICKSQNDYDSSDVKYLAHLEENNDCNDIKNNNSKKKSGAKKNSGSRNKLVSRKNLRSVKTIKITQIKSLKNVSQSFEKSSKEDNRRPRGRPRKNVNDKKDNDCNFEKKIESDNSLLKDEHYSHVVSYKIIKKEKKQVFSQKKKTTQSQVSKAPALKKTDSSHTMSGVNSLSNCIASPDKDTSACPFKYNTEIKSDKSVFQDSDLDAILKSVKSSIKSQFASDEVNSDIMGNISFDNPFKVLEPPPFPKMFIVETPKASKPKPKKTKLHVMMRRNKRKKRKKVQITKTEECIVPPVPKKIEVFNTLAPLKKMEKFTVSPQKKYSSFSSPSAEKRLSFFTSCSQPSKILASSRLNVFRSGTGVEEFQRNTTQIDTDQSDLFDKRNKKRHRLLYRKSKHKNIIDPVFAADLDAMVSGLNNMAISENPADNYIRVRPGEMPLPSIFRVIKIDLSKSKKDRVLSSENLNSEKSKPKKETSPYEISAISKTIPKGARKKSVSDNISESKEFSQVSDSHDQCLPPKKRHRLVNLESTQLYVDQNTLAIDNTTNKKDCKNLRKCKRLKKIICQEENRYCDKASKLNKQLVTMELTIDTSSYTTGGSSVCVSPLSPCPSRFSTRSSTQPSLSSPSPTESAGYRSRIHSKNNVLLACPLHSLSSCLSDHGSCPECQLLDQCTSPASYRSGRSNLRSSQLTEAHYSSDCLANCSETSPLISDTYTDKVLMRSARKRHKSANFSADESDYSPPRLEKNSSLSPLSYRDNFFTDPPELTNSTFKMWQSPTEQHNGKCVISTSNFSTIPLSPKKKLCSNLLPVKSPRQTSPNKVSPQTSSAIKKCNKNLTTTVILPTNSDYEPLPLTQCNNRSIMEEIQAALLEGEKDDDSHDSQDYNIPLQLPRKRFQRVGLFSDFYKDDEPRKRCEIMVKCRDKLIYVKEEHDYGLMPQPLHIGQSYMKTLQNFQLPYNIWWQHVHNQLPKKQEQKLKFRTIRTNVYSDNKVNCRKLEIPLCNCIVPLSGGKGCLDDCLNRMIYTECTPSTCSLGDNCDNQKIQKHEWAQGLEKFLTKDRGFGIRTKSFIKNGQFILEYLGEVVSEIEFRRRMMEEYSEECHHYALHLDSGSVIDGYRMGNIGRYVNHSCKPNCEMQKWNVNGLSRMVLFALRDISPGEELTYDYNFDPFNQETQQECRCGSCECRGVIGGKTQRNNNNISKPEKLDDSKDKRKSKLMHKKIKEKQTSDNVQVQFLSKPMTFKERCYARKHCIFLVRNVDKVRNQRHPGQDCTLINKEEFNILDCNKIGTLNPDLMLAQLNERSVKTRLAAYAKDNPELAKRHQLAQIFDKMLTELLSLKDEDGDSLVTQLMTLPSRKKQPQYYQVIREPIDLSMIKQKVKTGFYDHLSSFNADLMLLFSNVELYCGPKSDMGQIILKLRRVLNCVKAEVSQQIDELLGAKTTKAFMDTELEKLEQASCKGSDQPEEDIIRCICGVTRDEGLMLQCEKCQRWQHCDCVRASGKEEHYLCDRCEPRYYDPEILLIPPPTDAMPNCTHYMTLLKDDVQYAVGDCVYVMRDCKRTSSGTPIRSSHRLMATVNPDKLDIFRIEQLWKDPKGEKFASGTPYLRPQETFHEPSRKFYHNELFRTPNFEIIPMDLVMAKCIVMDPNTFCKGRPKGYKEQDIYICEYRVDKTAHLFHKIQKIRYPINTGRFCFDWFKSRLNIRRTYLPHEVPEEYKRKLERGVGGGVHEKNTYVKGEEKNICKKVARTKTHNFASGKVKIDESIKNDLKLKAEVKVNVKKGSIPKNELLLQRDDKTAVLKTQEKKRQEKRHRLDKILMKLLNNIPGKQKIDLTYLLDEGKRVRKKVMK